MGHVSAQSVGIWLQAGIQAKIREFFIGDKCLAAILMRVSLQVLLHFCKVLAMLFNARSAF